MTPREQLAFGFLLRCAEEGLDEEQTRARIAAATKRADFGAKDVIDLAGNMAGGGLGILKTIGLGAYPVATGLGLGAGALGGYAAGKALDPHYDADDVRNQELLAAYDTASDDMDEDLKAREELAQR